MLESGQVDGVRGPIAVNSDFWSLLYELSEEAPPESAKVMGAYLRRAAALSAADGIPDPFDSDHLPNYSSSGGEDVISKIAAGAPESFITEALPFVTQILENTADSDNINELRHGNRWHHRFTGEPTGVDDAVFLGLEAAFRALPDTAGNKLLHLVGPLDARGYRRIQILGMPCSGCSLAGKRICSMADFGPAEFGAGVPSNHRWATRERLIECATRSCDTHHLDQLTAQLLSYYPPYERTARGRVYFGRART